MQNEIEQIANSISEIVKIDNNVGLLLSQPDFLPIFAMYWDIQGVNNIDKLNTLYLMINGIRTYLEAPVQISFVAARAGKIKELLDDSKIRCLRTPLTEKEKLRQAEYIAAVGKNEKDTIETLIFVNSSYGATFAKVELKGTFRSIWEEPLSQAQLSENKVIILSQTDLTTCFERSNKSTRRFLNRNKFRDLWRIAKIDNSLRTLIDGCIKKQQKLIKNFIDC